MSELLLPLTEAGPRRGPPSQFYELPRITYSVHDAFSSLSDYASGPAHTKKD
jgi:hypothetical protein